MSAAPMVEIIGVSKRFSKAPSLGNRIVRRFGGSEPRTTVHAIDGVDLKIARGQVLGLVGESGCGKSTLGRIVAGIMPPSEGEVRWQGGGERPAHAEARRAKLAIQMIFQDPMSSLNPRMRVADIVGEAPLVHGLVARRNIDAYVDEQLVRAGLDPAYKKRYPHQFSGGQRQRISIARALAVQPEFLVCDESVAALDVSIQAQVINLFMQLREELNLTYLFISHDLGVVEHLSDRVAVMYLGRIIEEAPVEEIFAKANHPYTQSLLAAVPRVENRKSSFATVKGEIPSPLNPPAGCHFHPRCPHAFARCRSERPAIRQIAPDHFSACHLNDGSV
ncbi:oligopeptide/dipeptide ABC transporter ATP-binding protein [Mesorhizobium sp. CAU 1732]|uniref:ABC transporter ATP-binding protein n=1 Tax=Mesorhizobium sp. CAU 1732 TaxID=3140358 RepID=UPI0032610871